VKYQQVVRTISEMPWAILPAKLAVIQELLAARVAGERLSAEEIRAAIDARQPGAAVESQTGTVKILPLSGVLIPRADLFSEISGATSLERWQGAFAMAVEDDNIDAIIIDIDSPGGSVFLVAETAQMVYDARGVKPIIAVANAMAASAAYHIASQADELVVTPSGVVGSIGVLAAHQDVSAMQEKLGVKTTLISAGKFKTEGNPFEPLSEDAQAAIQERIDEYYARFVADVARGRGVSEDAVRAGFGQGRVVTANLALEGSMVDGIDTLEAVAGRVVSQVTTAARTSVKSPMSVTMSGDSSALRHALLRAGLAEPDRELPPGYKTPKAAESGLSFADEAAAAHDVVADLIDRTLSLAELRRGRLTAAKREQLLAIHDRLNELAVTIDGLLAQSDRSKHADALATEMTRFEALRANL
jgi:signal peptide peptidase SppA